MTSAFDDFSTSLDSLLASVPDLESECRSFADSTLSIQKERRKASVVQEHQDKLVDVLEIPRLMDTCVRNGYYAEALELEAHARDLRERYGEIPLIQDVANQVERVRQLMLAQLLALLREPVKLPTLVKAVNFLRKMEMSESLPLAFLLSRQHNLLAQLVSIEKDKTDPTRYIKRYIDIFREHVYDIISQFSAIFLDSSSTTAREIDVDHLTTFAQAQVEALLFVLQTMVPNINDPASLSSILIQLGYCSLSFARVGLDFSHLVIEPFELAVEKTFTNGCASAAADFAAIFKNAIRNGATPTETLMLSDHMPELDALQGGESQITQPPPLASYPPIATLLNGHISALNALRLLAPLSLQRKLAQVQKDSLAASSRTLLQYIQLSTSDHTPLPPVSLSRSNSQTKHSRNPSASLRRRATNQGPGQSQAQIKVSIVALKAFKVAADWLIQALNQGIYKTEVNGDSAGAVAIEVEEWLRTMDPKPIEAMRVVDEPLAMTAGDSSEVKGAAADVEVEAQPLVAETSLQLQAEPEVKTVPTSAIPPERDLSLQSKPEHEAAPVDFSQDLSTKPDVSAPAEPVVEVPKALPQKEPQEGPEDAVQTVEASATQAQTPAGGSEPSSEASLAAPVLTGEETVNTPGVNLEAPTLAPVEHAVKEVTHQSSADKMTATTPGDTAEEVEPSDVVEEAGAPVEALPVALKALDADAPQSADETLVAEVVTQGKDEHDGHDEAEGPNGLPAATLSHGQASAETIEPVVIPKADMDSLFEPTGAAQDVDPVVEESVPIVEPVSLQTTQTTTPREATWVEPADQTKQLAVTISEEPLVPSSHLASAADEKNSSREALAESAETNSGGDTDEPRTAVDATPEPTAGKASTTVKEPDEEPTLEPAAEAAPPVIADLPSAPDQARSPDEPTPTPSIPVSEPTSTNPSRAPSPDNAGPVKTSGGGKKKNKKKGKKK